MSWPRNRIRPAVGLTCPVTSLNSVLLPAPLGPMRQRSSRSPSVKSTPRTASTPPKLTDSPTVWRTAALMGGGRGAGRAEAARAQPAERGDDPPRDQEHESPEGDAENQVGFGPVLAAGLGGEVLHDQATDDGTDQRAEAADDDPDDDLRRHGQAEHVGAHKGTPVGEQRAGQAGDATPDREGEQLVEPHVVAQQLTARLVLPDGHHHPPEVAGQPQMQI